MAYTESDLVLDLEKMARFYDRLPEPDRSLSGLARVTGMRRATIYALAHGRGTLKSVARIIRALGCEPGDILSVKFRP